MVRDLDMPVEIVVCPIVRQPDGLAMSSRNTYLDPQQRKSALVLYRSLMRVEEVFRSGERNSAKLISAGKEVIAQEASARLDYLEVVDPDNLDFMPVISADALVAMAAFVGTTRLIDNVVLKA